jgi:hypothetical protein
MSKNRYMITVVEWSMACVVYGSNKMNAILNPAGHVDMPAFVVCVCACVRARARVFSEVEALRQAESSSREFYQIGLPTKLETENRRIGHAGHHCPKQPHRKAK